MRAVIPFLVVGGGGAIGSMLRYGLSVVAQRFSVTFPHGTLWANLLGCFIIGVVAALSAKTEVLSPTMRLLLATGLCGGFTTMSTFAYEMFKFVQATEYLYASGYFLVTVLGVRGHALSGNVRGRSRYERVGDSWNSQGKQL